MVLPLGDLERTRITPFVTYALIAINVVVFLVQETRAIGSPWPTPARPGRSRTTQDIEEPIVKAPAVVRVQDPRIRRPDHRGRTARPAPSRTPPRPSRSG